MIEINNLTTISIDEQLFKKIAHKVLKNEGKEKSELSLALIGQQRMRKLNRMYRGKNRSTDVLAFGINKKIKFISPFGKELGLGEVVICTKEVKKNAKRFKSTFNKELATCLIHGILHLLGYNHEKGEEMAEKMREKEKFYLDFFFTQ